MTLMERTSRSVRSQVFLKGVGRMQLCRRLQGCVKLEQILRTLCTCGCNVVEFLRELFDDPLSLEEKKTPTEVE
jgi:hypothetical protein